MTNKVSICWKCINKDNCEIFEKNPNSTILIGCGRFLMSDDDKAITATLYGSFMAEKEDKE